MINLFIHQEPVTDEFILGLNAGVVWYDDFSIAYQTRGAEDTFTIGQPVYDEDNNLMGYLAVGLIENLNYAERFNGEEIPVYTWVVDNKTEYCTKGKKVFTYWQRWREATK